MTLLDLYKKSNTYKVLLQDFVKGTLSHTYMLKIPDNLLAKEYAKFFAMQIYCENNHTVCLECSNCKKILHDNMGDVKYFPKSTKLSVEESRQIVADSLVMPYEMNKKLFIINNFELATSQSQNALLKVLEEPTDTNIFLLIAESDSTVLRTILSRAKKIVENVVDEADLLEYLRNEFAGVDSKVIEEGVALSRGNLTLATDLISNKAYQQLNSDILNVIGGVKTSSDVLRNSGILAKYKDNLNEMLDIMLQTFLDIKVALTTGSVPNRLQSRKDIIINYTPDSITMITKIILECKNRAKFNCSYTAVIDYLLFGILEAKFVCR